MPPMMGRSVTMPVTLPEHESNDVTVDVIIGLTVNCHTDDEEGDEDVDDIQSHQSVLRTRKAATHVYVWKIKKNIIFV